MASVMVGPVSSRVFEIDFSTHVAFGGKNLLGSIITTRVSCESEEYARRLGQTMLGTEVFPNVFAEHIFGVRPAA
jgi:hypothetical protein